MHVSFTTTACIYRLNSTSVYHKLVHSWCVLMITSNNQSSLPRWWWGTGLVINGSWVQLLATALLGSEPGQGAHCTAGQRPWARCSHTCPAPPKL